MKSSIIKTLSISSLVFLAFISGFFLGNLFPNKTSMNGVTNLQKCLFPNLLERLKDPKYERRSLGEKMLVPRQKISEDSKRLNQVGEAIKNCDLDNAITKLQEITTNDKEIKIRLDPEILIYLNNLKALQSQKQLIQIVVSLPIDESPSDMEVLRGVAMAQSLNNNNNDNLLLVEIAKDDRDNINIVKFLAKEFVDDPKIKAVIGHRSSNASLWAAEIYQPGKLVMISPTSTTTKLALKGNYIFQSALNNDILVSALVKHIYHIPSIEKILICHTDNSDYSMSFADAIIDKFQELGKENKKYQIINEPCFHKTIIYDPQPIISLLKQQKIQGLILIPSTDPKKLDQTTQLVKEIKKNNLSISIFGGDTLYGGETFENFSDFSNMVLTVPSHPDVNPKFAKQAQEMWKGSVAWRTFTAFDATQAVIEGFKNSPTLSRQDLQKNLLKPGFQFQGATGNVTFSKTGARQGKGCIVKISDSHLKQKGTPFELIQCDDSGSESN